MPVWAEGSNVMHNVGGKAKVKQRCKSPAKAKAAVRIINQKLAENTKK